MKYKTEVIIVLLIIAIPFAIANSLIDNSQSEFDLGTYTNTQWNTDHVELSTGHTSGIYTSQIFNVGSSATWNNISWQITLPNQENFYIIDGQKDVFSSTNGINWTTKSTNYGGTNDLDGLISASSGELILLDNKDIYSSSDYGTTWTKINDSFTSYSNNGIVMTIDNNDNIYIIDGAERVFKSTNLGYTWTEINNDFNTGTNNAKGLAVNSSDNLFVVDGSGNVYSSSDLGVTWTYLSDYGGGSETDDITSDQNDYLYILLNKDIYRSTDSGSSWSKINDKFTPYTNNGLLLFFDKKDSLIIADNTGRIFKSSNLGLNWTELGDCNGAATNNPKVGTTALYDTSVDILVRSCDDSNCDLETFVDIVDTSPQDLSVTDNQYFQYKFNFETNNPLYSPELSSVTIDYTLPDLTPPSSITNLNNNSQGLDFIYWTWTNPTEPDFSENIIYFDNINILNTSNNFYNATSLSEDTEYTIKIHTIDTNGNINTADVTNSARTLKTCVENWTCTDWSTCDNSTQTRICTDQNLCGTELNKPEETQSCTENPGGGPSGGGGNSGMGPSTVYQTNKKTESTPQLSEQEPISNTNEQKNKQTETQKSQEAITSYIVKQPSFFNKNLKHIITSIIMAILAVYIFRKEVNK